MKELDPGRLVIVVGAPRSGTTMLGETLGDHHAVTNLYEPYFIWERFLGPGLDDARRAEEADARTIAYVRREFERERRRKRADILVEKTPRNSFKIPFMHRIFPSARWIHIVRDGRDAVLSIHRQWQKRMEQQRRSDPMGYARFAWSYVCGHHGSWRNRGQMLLHEFRQTHSINPLEYLNQNRWDGRVGWGPRFPGWREVLETTDLLTFNAWQWRRTVESVVDAWPNLPEERRCFVGYEALVRDPISELGRIQHFMGVDPDLALANRIDDSRIGRWRDAFTAKEIATVERVIGPTLEAFDYPLTIPRPVEDRKP